MLTNQANGKVIADAIKLVYVEVPSIKNLQLIPKPEISRLKLKWDGLKGIDKYNVYISSEPIIDITSLSPTTTDIPKTEYLPHNITKNQIYYFAVTPTILLSEDKKKLSNYVYGGLLDNSSDGIITFKDPKGLKTNLQFTAGDIADAYTITITSFTTKDLSLAWIEYYNRISTYIPTEIAKKVTIDKALSLIPIREITFRSNNGEIVNTPLNSEQSLKLTIQYSQEAQELINQVKDYLKERLKKEISLTLAIHRLSLDGIWELASTKPIIDPVDNTVTVYTDKFSVFTILPYQVVEAGMLPEIIYIYPNPYIPYESIKKKITFTNLKSGTEIKIFNIAGDIVYEDISTKDGHYEWPVINKDNKEVASGVYIYILKKDGDKIKSGKIAIIR